MRVILIMALLGTIVLGCQGTNSLTTDEQAFVGEWRHDSTEVFSMNGQLLQVQYPACSDAGYTFTPNTHANEMLGYELVYNFSCSPYTSYWRIVDPGHVNVSGVTHEIMSINATNMSLKPVNQTRIYYFTKL